MIDVKYNETPEKLKTSGFMVSEYTVLTNRIYVAGSWQPVETILQGSHLNFNKA